MHQQSAPHPTVPRSRLPVTSPQGPIFPNLYRPEAWVPSLYSPAAHARGHVAGYSGVDIAVRCPPSSSHSHGMQQRLGGRADFPVGSLLCTRGRVDVRPSTHTGVPETKRGGYSGGPCELGAGRSGATRRLLRHRAIRLRRPDGAAPYGYRPCAIRLRSRESLFALPRAGRKAPERPQRTSGQDGRTAGRTVTWGADDQPNTLYSTPDVEATVATSFRTAHLRAHRGHRCPTIPLPTDRQFRHVILFLQSCERQQCWL